MKTSAVETKISALVRQGFRSSVQADSKDLYADLQDSEGGFVYREVPEKGEFEVIKALPTSRSENSEFIRFSVPQNLDLAEMAKTDPDAVFTKSLTGAVTNQVELPPLLDALAVIGDLRGVAAALARAGGAPAEEITVVNDLRLREHGQSVRYVEDLEKEGFGGNDRSLVIALEEYGLAWRRSADGKDIEFLHRASHGIGYTNSFFKAGLDPQKEWDWAKLDEVAKTSGITKADFLAQDTVQQVVMMHDYYGVENVMGTTYHKGWHLESRSQSHRVRTAQEEALEDLEPVDREEMKAASKEIATPRETSGPAQA